MNLVIKVLQIKMGEQSFIYTKNTTQIDKLFQLGYNDYKNIFLEDIIMPKGPRKKDPEAIYHIMSHSIAEFDLFPDITDKEYFLDLLQKYNTKYDCKIYGYCLMSNHYHIILDTCGFDISKYMKSLNQSYVRYINKTYKRKGHLLAERFKSKIIDNGRVFIDSFGVYS